MKICLYYGIIIVGEEMKKGIFLLLIMVFGISGCGKEREITIKCTNTTYNTKNTVEVTDTSKYNGDFYMKYSKVVTVESGFKGESDFIVRKHEYEELSKNFESGTKYNLDVDDNNMVIIATLIVENYDLSTYTASGKENLKAKHVVENYESQGAVCEIKGATRAELGLEG